MTAALPLIELILLLRVKKNKEDFSRLNERRGISLTPRPDGKLIWLHASSVGESMAALSLINRLLETEKEGKVKPGKETAHQRSLQYSLYHLPNALQT